MRRFLTAIAVVAAAITMASPSMAIVAGEPDNGEHPYVGQLLFFVPDAIDPRFDDPGGWFTCTGTLVDANTVVTAGHCTFGTGENGESPGNLLSGGTDVWFNVSEAPDFSILPPSTTFAPDRNEERYEVWSMALNSSREWVRGTSYTHPEYVDAEFLLHDLGVLELDRRIRQSTYGKVPPLGFLDQFDGGNKKNQRFTAVGYGLEESGPFTAIGGDTRRKAEMTLVSLKGAFGLKGIAANFTHSAAQGGGTCFGDSGGPTFVTGTNQMVTVTSFGFSSTCTVGGYYRLDQPDDLAFLATFGIKP